MRDGEGGTEKYRERYSERDIRRQTCTRTQSNKIYKGERENWRKG